MGAIVGFLRKPADTEQLREVLQRIANKSTQAIKRVLVVEDDPVQRDAVFRLIGNGDVKTTTVGSGQEALSLISRSSFDCLILDLSLPDMSGYEFLEKMSKEPRLPHPPVIVYTGRDLTREEESQLLRYSKSIIIKGANSPERLLNETLLFPAQGRVQAAPPNAQTLLKEFRNRERIFEGRKIMVVDDDVRNVFALTSALESRGARVLVGRNGLEAIKRLEEHPDTTLILMDIMMPEMDGLEATRRIRAQERFQHIPIIAVTAKAMKDDQERSLEAGANDYLAKPIDLDKLMSLIRVWIPKPSLP